MTADPHAAGAPQPDPRDEALAAVQAARESRASKWVNKFITDEQLDTIEAALRGVLVKPRTTCRGCGAALPKPGPLDCEKCARLRGAPAGEPRGDPDDGLLHDVASHIKTWAGMTTDSCMGLARRVVEKVRAFDKAAATQDEWLRASSADVPLSREEIYEAFVTGFMDRATEHVTTRDRWMDGVDRVMAALVGRASSADVPRPEDVAWRVVQRVAELPDRTSPDDWPEAMLVTTDELREIVAGEIAAALAGRSRVADHLGERSAPEQKEKPQPDPDHPA